LLANAVGQAEWMTQADRIRGKARSYSGSALAGISASCTGSVGAGLLANAVGQAEWMTQADRIRGQARSYSGSAWAGIRRQAQDLWEPACWRMRCVRRSWWHRQIAFAGKRAP